MQSLDDFTVITECVPLEQVWFASSLTAEPELISTEELGRRLNFIYTDSILVPKGAEVELSPDEETELVKRKILELNDYARSSKTNSFVVRFISDEVGYGVFAKELISAASIVGLYAGVIEPVPEVEVGERYSYISSIGQEHVIDAKNFGGITRLIQHMPFSFAHIENEIYKNKDDFMKLVKIFKGFGYSLSHKCIKDIEAEGIDKFLEHILPEIKYDSEFSSDSSVGEELENKPFLLNIAELAIANIYQYLGMVDGKVCVFMRAMVDILPGQQLGVSYGWGYWTDRKIVPGYFNQRGEVLPKESYLERLEIILERYKLLPTDTFLPTIEKAFRKAAVNGKLEDVRQLLEYGVDIDAQDDNPESRNTALHWAISRQHDEATKLLLAWKARTNIENAQNETAEELLGERFKREDPSPRA